MKIIQSCEIYQLYDSHKLNYRDYNSCAYTLIIIIQHDDNDDDIIIATKAVVPSGAVGSLERNNIICAR